MTLDDDTPLLIDSSADALSRVSGELRNIDRAGRSMNIGLASAFTDLAIKGKSFEQVLSGLALRLSSIALNAAFKPLEQSISSGLTNLFSGNAFSGLGDAGAPAASGFSFGSLSSEPLATKAQAITVNISTPDVESFRRSETQVAAVLARSVARGNRNL
jgi:hypothetical protein